METKRIIFVINGVEGSLGFGDIKLGKSLRILFFATCLLKEEVAFRVIAPPA